MTVGEQAAEAYERRWQQPKDEAVEGRIAGSAVPQLKHVTHKAVKRMRRQLQAVRESVEKFDRDAAELRAARKWEASLSGSFAAYKNIIAVLLISTLMAWVTYLAVT